MPGFLRDCCVAIRRYLNEREEYNKTKINKVEVEEMELDQTITKNEPTQVGNVENLNLKEYLHLKLRLLQNLQQLTTIDEQKCVKKSDLREIIIQEIDLLTQLLDK